MIRIFIDSSVLLSAALSPYGYARRILKMGIHKEITLVISHFVVQETKATLAPNAPQMATLFELVIDSIPFEYADPGFEEVFLASQHVDHLDAPILAAARKGSADLLVTLDEKNLLDHPEVKKYLGKPVLTPSEAFAQARELS
jgi:predicted nucleic acid-binding protein